MEDITLKWVNPKEQEAPSNKECWVAFKNERDYLIQANAMKFGDKWHVLDGANLPVIKLDNDKILAFMLLPDIDDLPEWIN